MNYENFKSECRNRIHAYLPVSCSDWKVVVKDIYKVNEKLDAFSVIPPDGMRGKKGAYPVFYLQELYKLHMSGVELGKVLRYVADAIEKTPSPQELEQADFDLDRFQDCIVFQLINRERNEELLKTLPHRPFLDLAVIYRLLVFDAEGYWAGMIVTNDLMKSWKRKESDLFQLAWDHTPEALPFRMKGMEEYFHDCLTPKGSGDMMFVLSNDSMQFGASAMLYPEMLEQAAANFGTGFVILPGSVHELYLVNDPPERGTRWKDVVHTANRELVDVSEFLSDSVYYYDADEKTIKILS